MSALENLISDYVRRLPMGRADSVVTPQELVDVARRDQAELVRALQMALSAVEEMVAEAGTIGNYAPSMPREAVEAQAMLDGYMTKPPINAALDLSKYNYFRHRFQKVAQ